MKGHAASPTMYLLTFVTVALPPISLITFVSQVSPWSEQVLPWLATVPKVSGILDAYIVVLSVVVLDGLIFWGWTRKGPTNFPVAWWLSWWVLLMLGTVAAILSLPHHPCSSIGFLAILGFVLLYPLRQFVFKDVEPAAFFQAAWMSLAFVASSSLVAWIIWLSVGFEGRVKWTNWPQPFRKLVSNEVITWELAFVAWMAPLAIATELGLAALLCWMRRQHLKLAAANPDGPDRHYFIISAVKQLMLWIAAAALVCWLHAGLSAARETKVDQARTNLQDEVLSIALWMFLFTVAWTVDTIGPQEVELAAANSKVVQETKKMVQGDWTKALVLFVAAIPMCMCAFIDRLRRCSATGRKAILAFTDSWAWTSIIVKATWIGLIYVGAVVGFAKFTTVFLACVNEVLAGWPIFTVSVLMFLVGFGLFMLPPAPGVPIYIVMGIVITSCALRSDWSFEAALAWATFVTFAMKLAFTVAAQKWIGETLADNENVRRLCELHTPSMRAVEAVLKEPGLSWGKVMVLVGMPDWPVAVLCGMLHLSVLQVLIGISPVLVQSVFPCVFAGALMLTGSDDDSRTSFGLAEAVLTIAAILQAAAGIIAFFFVQEVLERDYDLLAAPRPEDEPVIELEKKQTAENIAFWKTMGWAWLPDSTRCTLIIGFVSIEVSFLMLVGPWHHVFGISCFKKFGLTDSVKHDLGGNPFGIVYPLGWLALALTVLSTVCLIAFYAVCPSVRENEGDADKSESQPLI